METLDRFLKKCLLLLLRAGYAGIKSLFPIPSGVCRHNPSCFCYAQEQLRSKNAPHALLAILRRLLTCNPFFPVKP
jgi:putative component of membrane protein insertase Oxa1/YidC/SpoIIIJ protein YidD